MLPIEVKRIGFYTSDQFWFHEDGNWQGYYDSDLESGMQPGVGPYESIASKQRVHTLLSAKRVFKRPDVLYNPGPYREADYKVLTSVHLEKYVDDPTKYLEYVPYNKSTVSIAKSAVQCCIEAAEDIHQKKIKHGYCLVRPPGHHAKQSKGMGFCMFNNVACTAEYLLRKYPKTYKNILILDIDVHHGNGTEEFALSNYRKWEEYVYYLGGEQELSSPPVYNENVQKEINDFISSPYNGIHFISWHQDNLYPINSGNESKNNVANYKLVPGSGWFKHSDVNEEKKYKPNHAFTSYKQAIDVALNNFKQKNIQPDLILVSAGFDTYFQDPLGRMNLSGTHYELITETFLKEFPNTPTLWIHEGGYSELGVPFCVAHVLAVLLNTTIQKLLDLPSTTDVFDQENLDICNTLSDEKLEPNTTRQV